MNIQIGDRVRIKESDVISGLGESHPFDSATIYKVDKLSTSGSRVVKSLSGISCTLSFDRFVIIPQSTYYLIHN